MRNGVLDALAVEALRAAHRAAPELLQLARALLDTRATATEAAVLQALVAYRNTDLGDDHAAARSARAVADASIRTLGRRLAIRMSAEPGALAFADMPPPPSDGLRYTAVTFLYPGSADDARAAIDEVCAVVDADPKADEPAHILADALDAATLKDGAP